jgi:DNA-directed RNA polymerase
MSACGRFWILLSFDFRGRITPVPNFNFTREDRIRALFLFTDGAPIGADGLKWLKAHIAAQADGADWCDPNRVAWTDKNLPLLRQIGEAVLNGADPATVAWAMPKHKYQFVAACAELVQALDQGLSFITRLPLTFDASCSGLQSRGRLLSPCCL